MKLLFATDGSVSALEAERLIDRIANRDTVEITVVSVVPTGIPQVKDLPLMLDAIGDRRKDAQALVDAAVEQFVAAGFKAMGTALEGAPGDQIVGLVERDRHDVTVVGAGNKTWLGHLLLGSVSSHVLHSSPTSVLLVHSSNATEEVAKVLVCTDGSEDALKAMKDYIELADPTRCDTVAMSVERVPLDDLMPSFPIPPMIDPDMAAKLVGQAEELAAERAAAAATYLKEHHFTASTKSLLGHPASTLLEEADKGGYELVVVGSRGQGQVKRALLGSVSDKLARQTRAVLVGRRP